MKTKEAFLSSSYSKLIKAISEIPDNYTDDIYALSFYFYLEDDDMRFPSIDISYNTNEQYKNETRNASSENEAKWNYAFWLQESVGKIGGSDDKLLMHWFEETPYFYSEEDDKESMKNYELFNKIDEKGTIFISEFIDEVIILTRRLFEEKVVEQKFGKDIPILIHELEYYDLPISWTIKANKPELIEDFINSYEDSYI